MQRIRKNLCLYINCKKSAVLFLLLCLCSLLLLAGSPQAVQAAEAETTELYEIAFLSENLEGEPILGYVYELFNDKNELLNTLDLTEQYSLSFMLPAGAYEIREKIVPPSYVPYKESIKFSLPFVDKEGRTERLLIKPKHEVKVSTSTTAQPSPTPMPSSTTPPGRKNVPRTGEDQDARAEWACLGILSGVFLLFTRKKKRYVDIEEDRL